MSSVHTLYHALTLPLMYVKCFVVDEIIFFEPKAKKHLPFFSYTAKHKKQLFLFAEALLFVHNEIQKTVFSFLPKQPLML